MYCKHCGKEIADDSKFCSSCGANQELESVYISSIEEQKTNDQSVKVSKGIYIWKRLIGSIIDKVLILLISLIVVLVICCFDYGFSGELGLFGAMLHMSKNSVYCAALGHVISLYNDQNTSSHLLEIDNRFQYMIFVELKISYLFILINIVYYVICEKMISSSLGKSFMNLRLVSVPYSSFEKLSLSKVLYRAFWFFLIMSCIIGLRWLLGFNYFIAVTLFFLIMDLPVLFKSASLLDILTRTKLIFFNKNYSQKEEKTHADYVEKHIVGDSNKVNGNGYNKFNIIICLVLIFLIASHVLYSNLYASLNYNNERLFDKYVTERFTAKKEYAGHIVLLQTSNEPSDVKEMVDSDILLGRYISTFSYESTVDDYFSYSFSYRYSSIISTISTYDISDNMSIFEDNEKEYEQCLSLLAQRAQVNVEKSEGDIKTLTWYGKTRKPTKYKAVCANQRLYIIKVESWKSIDNCSQSLFNLIDFTYYSKNKYYQTSLLIATILIGICFILFIAVNLYKFKALQLKNRYAYSLFITSMLSIAINIIIASVISYMLDKILEDDWSMIVLIGAEATTISSLCLSVFYYMKSKKKWDEYYLVPSVLKNNIFNSIKSDRAKKIFIKLVCYPLMILSLLPCGFYIVLMYSIPLLLVISYKRWHNWASASVIQDE
jgi:hypothetical protein